MLPPAAKLRENGRVGYDLAGSERQAQREFRYECPSQQSYTYDSLGRLSDQAITIPSDGAHSFDWGYNATTGQLQTLFYPLGQPATYRIEAAYQYQYGILQEIYNNTGTTTVWWQATGTNPRGQITQENTGYTAGLPRIISNRNYDAVTGWLGSVQTGVSGGAGLQNESLLYDEVGNLTQRQANNEGLTENFYYDNLYRLDHSVLGSTTNLQMEYDAMGDITSRSDVASGAAWTYDPTHKHQVTQAGNSSYTYDANGNANTRNGTTIGWTSYNYPSSVGTATETATFDYGPNHQRWRMVYNGPSGLETTYYATPLFEKVVTSAGTDFRYYIYVAGRPVVLFNRNTFGGAYTRSLLTDHQGTVSVMVASQPAGDATVNESFTAYGNRREASTWSGPPTSAERTAIDNDTREGYTFQTVLGAMGLNHMNGRVEDAITGRFLSADPHVPQPGNTQSWNRYSYVNNNPMSMVDPSGFVPGGICFGSGYCPSDIDHAGSGGVGSLSDGSFGGFTGTADVDDALFGPSDTGALTAWFDSAANAIGGALNNAIGGAIANGSIGRPTAGDATASGMTTQSGGSAQSQACASCGTAYDPNDITAGITVTTQNPNLSPVTTTALYMGFGSVTGGGSTSTTLFRAVSPAELTSIRGLGTFTNPPGIESKYFSTTLSGAQSYAAQAEAAFGDEPYSFVQTSIPNSQITPEMVVSVDGGIDTVVVPTGVLPTLTEPIIIVEP